MYLCLKYCEAPTLLWERLQRGVFIPSRARGAATPVCKTAVTLRSNGRKRHAICSRREGPSCTIDCRSREISRSVCHLAIAPQRYCHGDTLTFAEQFDGVSGDARIGDYYSVPHRLIREQLDGDMVVEANPPDAPLGVFKGLVRRIQRARPAMASDGDGYACSPSAWSVADSCGRGLRRVWWC
jgi:hypothetical protein